MAQPICFQLWHKQFTHQRYLIMLLADSPTPRRRPGPPTLRPVDAEVTQKKLLRSQITDFFLERTEEMKRKITWSARLCSLMNRMDDYLLALSRPRPRFGPLPHYQPLDTCHYHHRYTNWFFQAVFLAVIESVLASCQWLKKGGVGSKGRFFAASGNAADTGEKEVGHKKKKIRIFPSCF